MPTQLVAVEVAGSATLLARMRERDRERCAPQPAGRRGRGNARILGSTQGPTKRRQQRPDTRPTRRRAARPTAQTPHSGPHRIASTPARSSCSRATFLASMATSSARSSPSPGPSAAAGGRSSYPRRSGPCSRCGATPEGWESLPELAEFGTVAGGKTAAQSLRATKRLSFPVDRWRSIRAMGMTVMSAFDSP